MSRNLKTEYEAMLDQEIPDLWSRIEPRLADKRAAGTEAPGEQGVRTAAGADALKAQTAPERQAAPETRTVPEARTVPERPHSRKRGISRRRIAVWSSLAAACVCLMIALPAWFGSRKGSSEQNEMLQSDMSMEMAADDCAGEESGAAAKAEESPAEDAYEPEDIPESMYDEDMEAAENSGDGASLNEESREEKEEFLESLKPQQGMTQSDGAPVADDSNGVEEQECEPENAAEPAEAVRYECSGRVAEMWQDEEGYCYRITLADEPEGNPLGESEIVVLQGEDFFAANPDITGAALLEDRTYTIVVEPEAESGGTRYRLIGVRP